MAHEGKNTHRLSREPLERKFHDEWKNMHEHGNTIGYILGDNNEPAVLSERDEMVAATVIQWLGSPVGQGFLDAVMGEDPATEVVDFHAQFPARAICPPLPVGTKLYVRK